MDGERETQRNRAGVQTWDEMGGGVADDAGCILPALVSASNDADPKATKVNVSVQDFPGLLRIVAWVLNGLELRVERATLSTTDGMAGQVSPRTRVAPFTPTNTWHASQFPFARNLAPIRTNV